MQKLNNYSPEIYRSGFDKDFYVNMNSKELDKKIKDAKTWMETYPQHSIGKWYYDRLLDARASKIGIKK